MDGLPDITAFGDRCSLLPNADECSIFRASDVRVSLAVLRDGEGDSRPNFEGTEEGQGAAGYRAAFDIPLESKDAGSGASRTDRPL